MRVIMYCGLYACTSRDCIYYIVWPNSQEPEYGQTLYNGKHLTSQTKAYHSGASIC